MKYWQSIHSHAEYNLYSYTIVCFVQTVCSNNYPMLIHRQRNRGKGAQTPPLPHFEKWEAEPPHISNVYTFNILKKALELYTLRRPRKHSLVVENSKIFCEAFPRPP